VRLKVNRRGAEAAHTSALRCLLTIWAEDVNINEAQLSTDLAESNSNCRQRAVALFPAMTFRVETVFA
jgi:hypothetical protein